MKKINAQGSLEFFATFMLIFMIFIGLIDFGLYFKDIYTVQAVSDAILANLNAAKTCKYAMDDLDEDLASSEYSYSSANEIVQSVIKKYYGKSMYPSGSNIYHYSNSAKFCNHNCDEFEVHVNCKSDTIVDFVHFKHKYTGIFMYKDGKEITSNISTNTSFF